MRIHHVQLLTKHLEQFKIFYINEFGLPLVKDSEDTFTVGIGRSELTFVQTHDAEDPFYHFAFDIPRNKIDESIAWLQAAGVTIYKFPDHTDRESGLVPIKKHKFLKPKLQSKALMQERIRLENIHTNYCSFIHSGKCV